MRITLHNEGAPIPEVLLERIFEYGVSEGTGALDDSGNTTAATGRRGQGLFVARTYMAKMGGTIAVRNCADGVEFTLGLPRLAA